MRKEGLPKYREVKSIDFESVRGKCIAKGWYTKGTVAEYEELADFIYDLEEATVEDLVVIANDILEHSDTEYNMEAILWELNKVCNVYYVRQ